MTHPHWDDDDTAAWHYHQQQLEQLATERNKQVKLSELVPSSSKYLSKDDVGTAGLNLTVKGFKYEEVKSDNGSEKKTVMYFVEPDAKPMILNKTNSQLLAVVTDAEDTDAVKGKVINVFHDRTISFGGKVVGGLRIRAATGAPAQASSAPDDDIPF